MLCAKKYLFTAGKTKTNREYPDPSFEILSFSWNGSSSEGYQGLRKLNRKSSCALRADQERLGLDRRPWARGLEGSMNSCLAVGKWVKTPVLLFPWPPPACSPGSIATRMLEAAPLLSLALVFLELQIYTAVTYEM